MLICEVEEEVDSLQEKNGKQQEMRPGIPNA